MAGRGPDTDLAPSGEPQDRATRILEAYGSDAKRWPVAERATVLAALAIDPRVAVARHREGALDGLLDSLPVYAPSAALTARIQAAASGRPTAIGWRALLAAPLGAWTAPMVLRPASAFAMAIILGVVTGTVWTRPADDSSRVAAEFVSLAFGHDYQMGNENEGVE